MGEFHERRDHRANAGSSSLKFSVYAVADQELNLAARGQIEGLGTSPRFKAKDATGAGAGGASWSGSTRSFGHTEAFAHLAQWLRVITASRLTPVAVGHRMVHGGLDVQRTDLIDADVLAALEKLIPLVPLHQPHNLEAIKAVTQLRPDLPQVACFDTAFHRRARVTERFGLPDELFQRGLRRWGFHGLSYEYIAGQFKPLAPDLPRPGDRRPSGQRRQHVRDEDGRSFDTTMSFSALDGLPMGTRCGSLDPGVILFLLQHRAAKRSRTCSTRSPACWASPASATTSANCWPATARWRPRRSSSSSIASIREIGSLTAALGGLDALIFTAGIGENSPVIRERICQGLTWLGVRIDPDANERGHGCDLSRGMYTIGVGDSDRRRGRDRLPHLGRRPLVSGMLARWRRARLRACHR